MNQLMNELINHKGVCRTVLPTPGLFTRHGRPVGTRPSRWYPFFLNYLKKKNITPKQFKMETCYLDIMLSVIRSSQIS